MMDDGWIIEDDGYVRWKTLVRSLHVQGKKIEKRLTIEGVHNNLLSTPKKTRQSNKKENQKSPALASYFLMLHSHSNYSFPTIRHMMKQSVIIHINQ
jgi:hypothetical protein